MGITEEDSEAEEDAFLTRLKKAYLGLRQKSPNYELLKLATLGSDGKFVFSDEYRKRFTEPRDHFGTFGVDRYTKALEKMARDS